MTFTMQDELKRIGDLLEAILKKLEEAPAPVQVTYYTPPAAPVTTAAPSGYRCSCGVWVYPGTMHSCSGRITYTAGPNGGHGAGASGTWSFPISGTAVGKTIT